jgi:hypothetical protein
VSPKLQPDPLVQLLRPDPTDFQDLVALDGLLGESVGGKQRLYNNLSLNFWVEIFEEDLVHKETVSQDGAPDFSVVWIRRGAQLTGGISPADPDPPPFLENPFTPEDLLAQDPPLWS